MRTRRILPLLLGGLAGVSACDAIDDADEGPIHLRPGGGFGCTWCGGSLGNSPRVNGASLADIDLDDVNSSGIKLRGLSSPQNMELRLEVDPATERFVGMSLEDPEEPVLQGRGLLGAKIVLEMPGATIVHLTITDYDEKIPSWAVGGPMVTAYRASYVGASKQLEPLCPTTSPENQWFTLIAGETYDRDTHEIVADPRAVSLACVGEAAAKMKLMDYGPQGSHGATTAERAATLRMITADYCGDGHSFTASGVAVGWRDYAGTVLPPTSENVMEAIWDEHGAVCLSQPRLVDIDDVGQRCAIASCSDFDEIPDGAVWRTMLPQ